MINLFCKNIKLLKNLASYLGVGSKGGGELEHVVQRALEHEGGVLTSADVMLQQLRLHLTNHNDDVVGELVGGGNLHLHYGLQDLHQTLIHH